MTVEDISPVAQAENWKNRVRLESEAAKQWKGNWGFLQGTANGPNRKDSLDEFVQASISEDVLGMGRASTVIAMAKKKMSDRTGKDAMDRFLETYLKQTNAIPRSLPQDEFNRPILESHRIGWSKNSLEMFGRLTINLA